MDRIEWRQSDDGHLTKHETTARAKHVTMSMSIANTLKSRKLRMSGGDSHQSQSGRSYHRSPSPEVCEAAQQIAHSDGVFVTLIQSATEEEQVGAFGEENDVAGDSAPLGLASADSVEVTTRAAAGVTQEAWGDICTKCFRSEDNRGGGSSPGRLL
jgi:hypothetical protein